MKSVPLLETIPKVDAKPEVKKNNTTIDIAGKVGFDLNDSFNGTLTEYRPDASDLPNRYFQRQRLSLGRNQTRKHVQWV
jgi:hypothetical protein